MQTSATVMIKPSYVHPQHAEPHICKAHNVYLAKLRLGSLETLFDFLAALHAFRLLHAREQLQRDFVASAALLIANNQGDKGNKSAAERATCNVFTRSEEHTSELQSLMRTSYAYC